MQAEVNGIKLGFDMRGEGPLTLLMLHAFPFNRMMWSAQIEALTGDSVRVITLDLRGFGDSSVTQMPATAQQFAADLQGFLDIMQLDSVVVCGLSMGGHAAFACMKLFPERVQGLILADTRATADTDAERAMREANARYVEAHGVLALFERDLERLFSQSTLRTHPEIIALAKKVVGLNTTSGVATALRGMAERPDSRMLLPQISCPTLVIVGEQDVVTPLVEARSLYEGIPNAELEIIIGAGHLSNLERPKAFTQSIRRFLYTRFSFNN